MKIDTENDNLIEVLKQHQRWLENEPDENGVVPDEWRADFSGADLRGACLHGANLYGANFRGANLYQADLTDCDLTRCDFTGANLYYTRLEGANVHEAINIPFVPMACPDTGAFIGWKQALYKDENGEIGGGVIVKLLIPEDAERTGDTNRECRANKVTVLEIQDVDGHVLVGGPSTACAVSIKNRETEYRVGETVTVPSISNDGFFKHRHGAFHYEKGLFFFVNRREAVLYLTGGEDENGNPIDIRPMMAKQIEEEAAEMGITDNPDVQEAIDRLRKTNNFMH